MDESNIQLSLNLDPQDCQTFQSKKNKIHGDRRSRVKQRKNLRVEKEKGVQRSAQDVSQESEMLTGNKRKLNPHVANKGLPGAPDNNQFKKRKSDGVIASLFRKNPEIPKIASAEVETVTEEIFTGRAFADLPIHPYLVSNLQEKQGFKEMTTVQQRAIPVLLKKRDALVKSQTGSGKTLAYAVPIIQSLQSRMIKVKRDDGPYALVIVPTRELALQSYDTFVKLLRTFIWIVPGCLMGGEKKKGEKSRLRKGVNILIATPGRLMDHIKTTNVLSLARIRWLIIDEADRMLELGYERDIAQIINALTSQCPDPPQTVLLSATLSEGVERLSSITLNNPEHIDVIDAHPGQHSAKGERTGGEDVFTIPSKLKQFFIVTPCKLRLVTLAALILWKCKYTRPGHKMVVFLSTQDSVEFHSTIISRVLGSRKDMSERLHTLAHGAEENDEEIASNEEESTGRGSKTKSPFRIFQLHGDMDQKVRSKTFSEFGEAKSGVLICTDVAARGLDLPGVDWIVQFTSPGSTVDYIHRVGRTARAGSKGQSLLFLMPSEVGYIQELNQHKISMSQIEATSIFEQLLANIDDLPTPDAQKTSRQRPRTQEEAATYLQDRFEDCVIQNKVIHGLAGKGFQSYIRAYATYSKDVKDFFKVSDLHLGHVAKSFALREAPTKVHGVAAKFANKRKYKQQQIDNDKPRHRPLSFKQATLSEYSSGLDGTHNSVMWKQGRKTQTDGKNKNWNQR